MAPGEGPHSTNYPKQPHLDLTPPQPCFSWGQPWSLGHGPRLALLRCHPGMFPGLLFQGDMVPPTLCAAVDLVWPQAPRNQVPWWPRYLCEAFPPPPSPEETFWMPCDKRGIHCPKLKHANRFQTAGWPRFADFEAFWDQSRAPTSVFV